jgi:2-keto-4-pentenoate hydratase/2-oxohepta-3-ene-1,7-dioic acid hydratase in catechol pathway
MKLLRVGEIGSEKPAILDSDNNIRDLSNYVGDIDGSTINSAGLKLIEDIKLEELPVVSSDVRIGPCIGNVGKYVCIGLNYSDHAEEANMPIPSEPIIFFKAPSCISGPYDAIVLPKGAEKVDWEVELCVVIGSEAKYVSEQEAMNFVAGFCVANDVSERHFQLERGGQWVKGKSSDSFGPIGPWLVTKDEVKDCQNLSLYLEVDGRRYQDGSTSTMIFNVPHIVSYVSHFMSLQPGDIIATGTPPGVGMGQDPQIYLKEGQVVSASVEGLGTQRQLVVPWEAPK